MKLETLKDALVHELRDREDASPGITDALLICAAQKVEHYEISAYDTAITFSERLGFGNIARVLSPETHRTRGRADQCRSPATGRQQ